MTNNINKQLERVFEALGIKNQRHLSDVLGISPARITDAKNRGVFPSEWTVKLSTGYNLNPAWLLTGQGPMKIGTVHQAETHDRLTSNIAAGPEITRSVPLISSVQAGIWTGIVDNLQPGDAEEWVPVTKAVSKNAFALRVSGTSMEPDYREGDIIVVDPDASAHSGSMVVVRLNGDNEATFKKLAIDGSRIYLEPLNPRYQPMEITGKDYTICGVVRQMLRDVQ